MKRNIAIVAGGDTSEIVVSLRSAQGIYSFIDKEKYNLYIVEMEGRRWEVQLPDGNKVPVDRNDFSFTNGTEKVVFDFAYITIHGTPGEDGRLQGYFDMMRIPYSCCGVLAAAITYDKFTCNQYLKAFGVRIAESLLLRQGQSISDEEVVEKIGLPCFIKPSLGGSSFGVTKVKTKEQIQPAIVKAFGEAQEVLVEAFMDGTELTCGCYKTKEKTVIFPPTEVVTHNEFFDYDAKYNGQVDEITPARISDELTKRVQMLTSAIYDILGCSGIIRVDYIVTAGEKLNLLEVNTTPGMTLHFPANRTHHRHFPRRKECTEFRQSKKLFLRKSRRSLYQWQFEQILPNIISCSFIYKGIRARTYINIIKVTIRYLRLVLLHRQLCHPSRRKCRTTLRQRAKQAVRRLWRTLYRTEIHNPLIVKSRLLPVQHFIRQGSKQLLPFRRINRRINTEITGKHPIHIAVHHRIRHSIGKGTDSRCRILSHPFQSKYFRICLRENTVHAFRRRMKITGTRIISQPLPELHHLILVRIRQALHIRKTLDKP